MTELLSVGMVLPGAVGACGARAGRPRRPGPGLIPMIVMALAMASMVIGALGSPVLWAFALLLAAMIEAGAARVVARRTVQADRRADAHRAHEPLVAVGMAALILFSSGAHASTAMEGGHHHGSSPSLVALAILSAIAISALLIRPLATRWRTLGRWRAIEIGCMLAMTAVMAAAVLVQ